jgi:myo-inositol-1(or 4)-monophosphatase
MGTCIAIRPGGVGKISSCHEQLNLTSSLDGNAMFVAPDFSVIEYQVALDATRRGSHELMSRFGTKIAVQKKGIANFASEADLAAEAAIISVIREQFPNHTILAEESNLPVADDAEHLWVIDPLDGTNNFLHGIPHFAVSIAYYHQRKPLVGIVYNPVSNELFTAIAGQGAWKGTVRQNVSEAERLDEIVMACGFYYDRGLMMRTTLDTIRDLFGANIHGMRRFGAAALDLCHVGCGLFGLFFEYRLSPWDYAAGQLFVHEAGGRCTDCDGAPLPVSTGSSICATNGRVHTEALGIIQPQWSKLK